VLTAVELALEACVPTKAHLLNLLHRLASPAGCLARARVPRMSARVPARTSSLVTHAVFYWGSMVTPFETRSLTRSKLAYLEEQRLRNVSAAFTRLRRALDNMARPARGPSTPDRLAYLQAKFNRRVSDPVSRAAAATLEHAALGSNRSGIPESARF
jgi:hypothetical protein